MRLADKMSHDVGLADSRGPVEIDETDGIVRLRACESRDRGVGQPIFFDEDKGLGSAQNPAVAGPSSAKKSLSNLARGAIFREVVLAKVREEKEKEALKKAQEEAERAHGSP